MSLFLFNGNGDVSRAFYPANPTLAMLLLTMIVNEVAKEHDADCVVSGGIEGRHGRGSLHFVGGALDFDFPGVEDAEGQEMSQKIAFRAGPHFDVLWHDGHLHGEFQPKQGPNQGG